MIYIASLIYNIVFFSLIATGCIIVSVLFWIPQSWNMKLWNYGFIALGRFFLKAICGLEIEVRGKQYIDQNKGIYAAKHQSSLETYVMSTILKRVTFILKKELTYIPIFGWALDLYGMINIDRSSGGRAMRKMLEESKKAIKKNRPIIIFPEGTRMKPGAPCNYKPGVYFMYENLDLPVIPVALNTGMFWKKSSFLRLPGKAVIEFMEPMPKGLSKKEFMDELEFRIENKTTELNNEAIKNYPYTSKMMYCEKGDK
ncbi:MAG: 1-acyl-sn-glycerol-3-phosphate acyltransferase [Lactobacillus sp.]|jgi:1-acyl-sn-glycerol-3-phosphate acyltransferase|nr:1-acyl-sn-glycerol-3-phosphate acyltransferase [Lactobacillus sp.]